MLKFLWKDWVINRKLLLIFLVYMIIFWVWAALQSTNMTFNEAIVFSCFILALSSASLQARDERFQTMALWCSLPTDRRTIVKARFLCSWVFVLAGIAVGLALVAVIPGGRFALGEFLTVRSLLLFLFFSSIFMAPLLPFIIRFGIMGLLIFLVVMQLLGFVVLGIAEVLGRNSPINSGFQFIVAGFRWVMTRDVTPGYVLTLLGTILLINLCSLSLSRYLFARREL